jgi:putative ABC transport system permease protein
MLRHYLKQALQMLRENPLVNTISILGTALSIAMILVLVLVFQINNAGYAPESNRARMLYVLGTQVDYTGGNNRNRGSMSAEVVKECFYTLREPEAVTARAAARKPISLPGERLFAVYDIIYTDAGFWKVFDFRFLAGTPFSEADFDAGLPRAVISDKTARRLLGTADAVGKSIVLDYVTYTVCGVVKEVSAAAKQSCADVWAPYTSKAGLIEVSPYSGNMTGEFQTILLARNASGFEAIRAELKSQTARYNTAKQDYEVSFMDNPITHLDLATGSNGFLKKPLKDYLLTTGAVILFLLLIPAINLVGVVLSSVQKRSSEIGLRKAFGATRGTIIRQVLFENAVLTCIGAVLGLGLSFLFLYLGRSFMLAKGVALTAGMLLKPGLFLAVLFFAFLLNLLSAGLPALHISRRQIVGALNDTNK